MWAWLTSNRTVSAHMTYEPQHGLFTLPKLSLPAAVNQTQTFISSGWAKKQKQNKNQTFPLEKKKHKCDFYWKIYSSHTFFSRFHSFSAFAANALRHSEVAWIGCFNCVTSVHSHRSRLSVFDIVYLFIILRLRWNVTGGSVIKGEMEVEYVPAESLRSIRLWTDGLINRQWLEQIGSTGSFSRKAQMKTCGDNTPTTGVNADPCLAQSTGDLSVQICRHLIQNALTR